MKSFSLKLIVVLVLAIALSACSSSFSTRTNHSWATTESTAIAAVVPERITAPVMLSVPKVQVSVLTFEASRYTVFNEREVKCLTDAIYFESRSESASGKAGVGYVILNRTGHKAYPNSVCGVVKDRKHGCQFSWSCGKTAPKVRYSQLYEESRRVALAVLEGTIPNPIGDSLQFRQRKLKAPRAMVLRAVIGNHGFYASI